MKRKKIILIMFVVMASLFTSCSNSKRVELDTPDNATLLLTMAISNNNYDSFNELFSDGRKNIVSKETLTELSKISTAGSGNYLYELITFTNGEMLLVRYTAKKVDGEYKVEDVVKVPEEMKKLFKVK